MFIQDILGYSISGFILGIFGFFMVLRQQAMLVDCVSHGSIPGILVHVLIFQGITLYTAAFAAFISSMSVIALYVVTMRFFKNADASVGCVLSIIFGINLVLMNIIQHYGYITSPEKFLFGIGNVIMEIEQLYYFTALFIATCVFTYFFLRPVIFIIYDRRISQTLGLDIAKIELCFYTFMSIVVSTGVLLFGSVLIIAIMTASALVSLMFCNSFYFGCLFSGILGASIAFVSLLISFVINVPSSALTACVGFLFVVIVFFGKRMIYRGMYR